MSVQMSILLLILNFLYLINSENILSNYDQMLPTSSTLPINEPPFMFLKKIEPMRLIEPVRAKLLDNINYMNRSLYTAIVQPLQPKIDKMRSYGHHFGEMANNIGFMTTILLMKNLKHLEKEKAKFNDHLNAKLLRVHDYFKHKSSNYKLEKSNRTLSDHFRLFAASGLQKASGVASKFGMEQTGKYLNLASNALIANVPDKKDANGELDAFISSVELNSTDPKVKVEYETINERRKRDADQKPMSMVELLRVVDSLKLRDCVQLVICEVMCEPKSFGKPGMKLRDKLLRFQTTEESSLNEVRVYVDAGTKGSKFSRAPKDCSKCRKQYQNCPAKTEDVVRVIARLSNEC